MPWRRKEPGHQQPWYCLCRICRSWFYLRRILSTCVISMWSNDIKCKYMFMFPLKNLACKGLSYSKYVGHVMENWYNFQPVGPLMGCPFSDLWAEGCCYSLNALFLIIHNRSAPLNYPPDKSVIQAPPSSVLPPSASNRDSTVWIIIIPIKSKNWGDNKFQPRTLRVNSVGSGVDWVMGLFALCTSLLFHVNRPSHSWDTAFSKFDL